MKKRKFSFIGAVVLALAITGCSGVANRLEPNRLQVDENSTTAFSYSRSGTTDTVTDGYVFTPVLAKSASGYYQDKSSTEGLDLSVKKAEGTMWTTAPQSVSLKVTVGGGSTKNKLTNNVIAYLIDSSGDEIENTQTVVTTKVEAQTGREYTVSVPSAGNAAGVMIHHTKETSYNVRIYSFSLTYVENSGDVPPAPVTYTVTYDGSDSTGGTAPEDTNTYEDGATVTVLGNTGNLEKTDYNFVGWSDGETTYEEDDTFEIHSNTTLTPVWDYYHHYEDSTSNSTITWDLSKPEYVSISNERISWSSPKATMRLDKNTSGTSVNNYCPPNENSTRFYVNHILTISPVTGYQINSIVVTSNTENYASILKNSTFTNATASVNSKTVTINPTNRREAITATITNTTGQAKVVVNYGVATTAPTIELDKENISLKTNDTQGKTVTATVDNISNPDYSWETQDTNITLVNNHSSTVTIKPQTEVAGSATVTLTVTGDNDVEETATVNVTITLPEAGETAGTAFTVAQAISHIDAVIAGNDPDGNDDNYYYARGIVSSIVTPLASGKITYDISANGSTDGAQLRAYNGKNLNNTSFTNEEQLTVGDNVVIYGKLKIYNDIYEFEGNNYLVSRVPAPKVNSITLTPSEITLAPNASGSIVSLFSDIDIDQDEGLNYTVSDIEWSSVDSAVINFSGNQYSAGANHRSTTTIKASIGGKVYGSATVTIIDPTIRNVSGDVAVTWTKLTSIKVGIKVAFVYENLTGDTPVRKELTSVTESGTTYGAVSDYATNPNGTYILEVVQGNKENSYSFKTTTGKYLYWSSSNSLSTSSSISDGSSWKISEDHNGTDGEWKFVNVGTTARILQYNVGSPRFACYGNDDQTCFQIYQKRGGNVDVDLNSFSPVAGVFGTESYDEGSNLTINPVYLRFGETISKTDWDALDAALNITEYGVMVFRQTQTPDKYSETPVQDRFNNGDELSVFRRESSVPPTLDANGNYTFTAKINMTKVSNYGVVFCAAPYIVASGMYIFLDEIQGSVHSLADECRTSGFTDLSEDALIKLSTM